MGRSKNLYRRIVSLQLRIGTLSSLPTLIGLPPSQDIKRRQWDLLGSQLKTVETRLSARLKRGAREYLKQTESLTAARSLNALLGEIELELAKAFTFFDTYMDALTQRLTPELGRLLAGCDALAWEAIHRDHPALAMVEPPVVCCNRGFGAATVREGVPLPGQVVNPMPLIEIPYSRLKEKYNLTSVFHEVGHEAMVRLGLVSALPKAMRSALARSGAPQAVMDLFGLWSFEIGPDFWAFCACGIAEAGTIKEIVALPPQHAFRVSWTDPHPPPYLRVLLAFDWCRQLWGSGVWDEWEKEWLELYPLINTPAATAAMIKELRMYVPLVGRVLLQTRFRALSGRRLPDLFNMSPLAPSELQRLARSEGKLNLGGVPLSAHLAVFRLIKDQGKMQEEELDRIMTKWLLKIGEQRKQVV